jgi:hypothetical protein
MKQIRLPIALGGLGLGDASYTSAGAHYSSAADACALLFQGESPLGSLPLLCDHIKKWRNSPLLIEVHKTVADRFVVDPDIRKFGGMPQSITPFPDHDHFMGDETVAKVGSTFNAVRVFLRESYNHSQYARFLNDLNTNSNAEDRMRMAVIRSATGAEAGAWLRACVMYIPNRISNRHMTILLQLRLVMLFPEIKSASRACPFVSSNGVTCGEHCDQMGVHLRHCKFSQGNYPTLIHNVLVKILAELEKAAGFHVRVEEVGFMTGMRRADIVSASHVETRVVCYTLRELIDATCVDPRTPSNMYGEPPSYAISGASATRAETRKHNDADDSINNYFGVESILKALGFELFGHASKATQKHIVDRTKRVSEANGAPAHIVLAHWRIRISIALAKAVARAYDSLFMKLADYTEVTPFVRDVVDLAPPEPQSPPPNLHSCKHCGDKFDLHGFLGTHEQQCRANVNRTGDVVGDYVTSEGHRTVRFNEDYLQEQIAFVAEQRRVRGASPILMMGDGPDRNSDYDQVPPRASVEIVAAVLPPRASVEIVAAVRPHLYRVRRVEPRLNVCARADREIRERFDRASLSANNSSSGGSMNGLREPDYRSELMGLVSLDSDGVYGGLDVDEARATVSRNRGSAPVEGTCTNINVNRGEKEGEGGEGCGSCSSSNSSSLSQRRRSTLDENTRPNMATFFPYRRSAASYMTVSDDSLPIYRLR